jgi:hypothetical protein
MTRVLITMFDYADVEEAASREVDLERVPQIGEHIIDSDQEFYVVTEIYTALDIDTIMVHVKPTEARI